MALIILVIFLISTIGFIFMIKNTLNNFNTIRNMEIENFLKDQKEVLDFDLTSIKNVDEYYNKGILPYSDYSHSEGIVQYKINDTVCISSNVLLLLFRSFIYLTSQAKCSVFTNGSYILSKPYFS